MFQFPGFASATYVFSSRYPKKGGFPHSEMFGSKLVCQLPKPYRRLLRLSSPPTAKASTVCTYSLDHITQVSKFWLMSIEIKSLLLSIRLIYNYFSASRRGQNVIDNCCVSAVIYMYVNLLFTRILTPYQQLLNTIYFECNHNNNTG